MNSDKPDQVMENNAITSKNKKKSKGKSKTEAALTDVIGRSPKKSFWKSLFRFKKHHDDPGNSSTHVITVELGVNNEETKTAPNQRLSSIFEETADPANLDPKTIAEDISEIKKTIKRMSETSNPTVIIDKITQNYAPTTVKAPKKRTKDDAFLGYLSDISSTSSEDEEDEEDELEEPEEPEEKLDEQPIPGEYCGIANQDNNSTYTDLLADDKPNKGSSSLLKEGYSFEYSETSENSNGEVLEDKPEKVTFDNKVETKDANSIIMVLPLDENDSKVVIDEVLGNAVVEKDELIMNTSQEFGTTSQLDEMSDITEEDIIVARIQEIVNGQINPLKMAENLMMFEEEPAAITMDHTTAATSNLDTFSLPAQPLQKPTNRTFFSIPPEDVKTDEMDPLGKDGANRFVEESDPSTSSISKHSTYVHQDLDETLDIESIEEETELWMEDLNDFPFIATPDMVPLEDLDDDTNIDNEIFREFRLNKFFKMIQNNITMNVSIAYDPLFENEPMIQNFHTAIVEQEVRNEERNKVIRKRKMMSLLHDKQVFKDYLKEIELANISAQNVSNSSSKIKANEEGEIENAEIEDAQMEDAEMEDVEIEENPNITIPIKKASNKLIDMNLVPRGNIFNEATLLNLQTTKNKLEQFLVEENGLQNKVKTVFPKQYLRVYNFQTNRMNEDGLEETNSSMESCSISSEELIQIESDTTVGKSTSAVFNEEEIVENLSPSLQTKICAYETIDRDVEQLITELMGHVSDLKESCIKYGAAVPTDPEDDPVLFTKQANVLNEVQEIMNEILENVFVPSNDVLQITMGHFNQCFSFIREFGQIDEDKTALSYQIKPVVKNYYQMENPLSLTENLQRANGYLSTVYEEMCEYNPIPILGNEDFEDNENIQYMDESNMENDEEPIMEQSLLYNENLIDFDYQTDFETELSVIHEEDEPSSSTCDIDYTNNINNNNNNTAKTASLDIAENIIQFIEKSVSEKLSSVENNCDDLQDYDEDTLNITQTMTEEETKPSNMEKLEENEDNSCATNTTKHNTSNVKFNSDNDFATASNSRDNKFEPQPGTSKQQANGFLKADKSSATICSSIYHLPSVPSTELVCTENSSQHSIDNGIETLLTKKFSELPNSSTEDIKPEDLQALLAFQVPSNFSQGATLLERKSPQTNLLELLRSLSIEDTKNLTKNEVDKCIEENLKSFQESIKETIKLNQKTIEMIQSSSSQINSGETPDVLTIISTLSCNMPESAAASLERADDAPLEEDTENETSSSTATTTAPTTTTTTKTESKSAAQSQPQQSQKSQKSEKSQQPQEWYGNNFFSKSKTNNSVPKLCQLSEKVYAKSETDNESVKDDTESTFSNHNFDVDTYTDISFEESTGLNRLKINDSETICQSEFSLDTQYLSCSNFSSRADEYSGKSRDESDVEETVTNSKTDKVAEGTTSKICSEIQNLMNGDLATKYLEKQFNFGINLSTLMNEEFERKAKLNFGEQL